jgi:hypothetical protein
LSVVLNAAGGEIGPEWLVFLDPQGSQRRHHHPIIFAYRIAVDRFGEAFPVHQIARLPALPFPTGDLDQAG